MLEKAFSVCIKDSVFIDPACGTAGFLISAFNYIKRNNQDEHGKSTLSADDMNRLTKNFAGYDISPDMVRLSRVNMYLHGFTAPNISEYDTLTSLDKWDDNYDVIFANPPFMTPKGGITPHSRYRVSAKRAEVLFADYIAEHLNPTGRAAIIVPEGIVFQSQTAYKALRKFLVDDNYLYGVISLPAGVFNPYSGVKTSILLIDKTFAKQRDSILFVKLNNDGFDLGAQRREIKGSEIPDVVNIFKDYQKGVDVAERANVVLAKKSDIAEQDYILVGERYKTSLIVTTTYPIVRLGDVCLINNSSVVPFERERFIYIDISSVDNVTKKISYENIINGKDAPSRARRQFKKGDILLSTVRPNLRAFGYVDREDTSNCIASTGFAVISCGDSVNSKYLYYLLFQDSLLKQMISMMGKGSYPSINQNDVSNLKFPLPPLTVQEEIVAEIERYQKIIDGARQVVDNYKPTIKIDPDWEHVKLGNVATLLNGRAFKQDELLREGKYPVLRVGNFFSNRDWYYSDLELDSDKYCDNGDLLFAWSASFGPKIWDGGKVIYHYHIWKILLSAQVNKEYLYLILLSLSDTIKNSGHGIAMVHTTKGDMEKLMIPLPPIDIQKQIADKIYEEMRIVDQNRRLIEIFQQKINDKISEVWGE